VTENLSLPYFGYTGQRNYNYINLLDYGARWYSAALGRFTQPDSIVQDLTNTQAWNRYAYVQNNPINYNDPTGHMEEYGANLTQDQLVNAILSNKDNYLALQVDPDESGVVISVVNGE
jgi:RHS repeat-associated protein